MKFLDLFDPITKGDYGLTDEAVYKSIQLGNKLIPLWGGNQEHIHAERFVDEKAKTKYDEPITIFKGDGIIISLDGSAGNMTYKSGCRFALNHHAGFFKRKEEALNLIIPEFYSIFYQEPLKEASISEGSKTLTLDKIYSMDFDIPGINFQREVMSQMNPLLRRKHTIQNMLGSMRTLRNKVLSGEYTRYQARDISVNVVLGYVGGNSGLTKEAIYQKVCLSGERYQILSGSTSEGSTLGEVPIFHIRGKPIKVFQDKEGILVVRKGKAGSLKYLVPDKYTLTDDAYILFLCDDCPYHISLRWLIIQYSDAFSDYSSSSANGTWNMSGFFKYMKIDIPDIGEQKAVVDEYTKLEDLQLRIEEINRRIAPLFARIFADTI